MRSLATSSSAAAVGELCVRHRGIWFAGEVLAEFLQLLVRLARLLLGFRLQLLRFSSAAAFASALFAAQLWQRFK